MYHLGVFTVPVSLLREPAPYLRVRDTKEWYVDFLVGLLLEEEEDHEDITAPLLVVCSVTKSEFKQKFINNYTFEVNA